MKVKVEPMIPARKLVAVIGSKGLGIYFRKSNDKTSLYFESAGLSDTPHSLEELVRMSPSRTAVYEGDVVTIEF